MDLSLDALRLVGAIAEAGTLTEAAGLLHLSQPAATHQLHQLEVALGMPVFHRRGRRLAFTEAGRLVLARARRIESELEGIGHDLRALGGLERGEVRIGGGSTATLHLLPPLVAEFRARHPGVTFYLREETNTAVVADLQAGRLELGVVTLPVASGHIEVFPWVSDGVVLVGWPGAPLTRGAQDLTALEGAPFIHTGTPFPLRQLVEAGLQAAGVAPRVLMELQSIEAIKAYVAAGLGYSALGRLSVERELAAGTLVELPLKGWSVERRLGLARRENEPLAPAAEAFWTRLRRAGA